MKLSPYLLNLLLGVNITLAQTQPSAVQLRFVEEGVDVPSFSSTSAWRTRQDEPVTLTIDTKPVSLMFRIKDAADYQADNDLGSPDAPLKIHSLLCAPSLHRMGDQKSHVTIQGNPLLLVTDESGVPPTLTLGARDPKAMQAMFDLALELRVGDTLHITGDGNQHFLISGRITQTGEPLNVVKNGSSTLELSAANTWTGGTQVDAGTIRLASGDAIGSGVLSVGNNAKVSLESGAPRAGLSSTLEIAKKGHLDLNGGAWVIDYADTSPLFVVQSMIRDGRLTSADLAVNQVIACAEASALGVTEYAGRSFEGDAVIVAVARPGDTNLDFKVDLEDLRRVKTAFNGPGDWTDGDVTGDGRVDFDDLLKISQNYDSKAGFEVDWQNLPTQ